MVKYLDMTRKLKRRNLLAKLSVVSIGAAAGCASSEQSNSDSSVSTDTSGSTETTSSKPESTPTSTASGWEQNVPDCSTGDYIFRVRGVSDGGSSASPAVVSVENIGVEAHVLSSVTVVGRYSTIQLFPDVELDGGESESVELSSAGESISSPDGISDIRVYTRGKSNGGCGGVGGNDAANSNVIESSEGTSYVDESEIDAPPVPEVRERYDGFDDFEGYSPTFGVVLVDVSYSKSGDNYSFSGEAINLTETDYRYVKITYAAFDEDESKIGEAVAEAGNLRQDGTFALRAGESWNFEAVGSGPPPAFGQFIRIRAG